MMKREKNILKTSNKCFFFLLLQYKTNYKTINGMSVPTPDSSNGVNALGLVVFSIAFGFVLGRMGEQGRPLRNFFDCLNEAFMQLVGIVIW